MTQQHLNAYGSEEVELSIPIWGIVLLWVTALVYLVILAAVGVIPSYPVAKILTSSVRSVIPLAQS